LFFLSQCCNSGCAKSIRDTVDEETGRSIKIVDCTFIGNVRNESSSDEYSDVIFNSGGSFFLNLSVPASVIVKNCIFNQSINVNRLESLLLFLYFCFIVLIIYLFNDCVIQNVTDFFFIGK
jgi:hypothetical protein